MLSYKSFFFAATITTITSLSYGQITERIKQRIKTNTEQKIEDRVVNKAGQKTDQALDSVFKERSLKTEDKSDEGNGENSTPAGNGSGTQESSNAQRTSENTSAPSPFAFKSGKYKASYTYQMEVKTEMTSVSKKGKKPDVTNMTMYYGEDSYMNIPETDKGETRMIMDFENNSMITLNEEDKTAMAISMDFANQMIANHQANNPTDSIPNYTITKTGNRKKVAGYMCDEYLIVTDEYTSNVWYSDAVDNTGLKALGENMARTMGKPTMCPTGKDTPTGMALEMHMVEKGGKQGTFDYVVKELNEVNKTVNTSEYTFQSF